MTLSVNKISKRYGNAWALKDVSFEVEGGSVIGLFGASGSGKSALLKVIAGSVKHNGGTISLDDNDITIVKPKERNVTFHDGSEEKGFKQIFGYFSGGISSGEGQFDRFEAMIANAGRVLLLDDPFSQMDPALRDAAFAAIRKAAKQRNRVVIFATSDFDQIMGLTDEVAFLSRGEIMQSGTPQDIYDNPATIEAARMTGENNLFVARRLSSSDDDLPEFHTIDGEHRIFAHRADKKRLGPINQNMSLAIRPESVSVTPGVTRPEDNLLRAVVKAVHFRGATSIIEFDADGLAIKTCVLKVPALQPGDECMLGLPPHRILILKD